MSLSNVPVLLIAFNRPDTTRKVFHAIRKAGISKLYVSIDAPRPGNKADSKQYEEVRDVVQNIDWKCEAKYNFIENNLGPDRAVPLAISWAFENEDSLIILEDDCVPSTPFLNFCNHCLNKYEKNSKVFSIIGRSHHSKHPIFKKNDYIFSKYFHGCGWATWKQVWNGFDANLKNFSEFLSSGGFGNVVFSKRERKYYSKKFCKYAGDEKKGRIIPWDYLFSYYILSNGGLNVVPAKNLIQNIGVSGVHSNGKITNVHKLKASHNYIIMKEPHFVLPDQKYDYYHFSRHILRIGGQNFFGVLLRKILIKIVMTAKNSL